MKTLSRHNEQILGGRRNVRRVEENECDLLYWMIKQERPVKRLFPLEKRGMIGKIFR